MAMNGVARGGTFAECLTAQLQELNKVLLTTHEDEVWQLEQKVARLEAKTSALSENSDEIMEVDVAVAGVPQKTARASQVQSPPVPRSPPAILSIVPIPDSSPSPGPSPVPSAASYALDVPTGSVKHIRPNSPSISSPSISTKVLAVARARQASMQISQSEEKTREEDAVTCLASAEDSDADSDDEPRSANGNVQNDPVLVTSITMTPGVLLNIPGQDSGNAASDLLNVPGQNSSSLAIPSARRDSKCSVSSKVSNSSRRSNTSRRSHHSRRRPSDASIVSRTSCASSACSVMDCFQVLSTWDRKKQNTRGQDTRRTSFRPDDASKKTEDDLERKQSQKEEGLELQGLSGSSLGEEKPSFLQKIIVAPGSVRHLIWEFAGLLLVIYDAVAIPLEMFDPPETTFTTSLAWTIRIFWTLDLFESFTTGYLLPQGTVETRLAEVAKHYAKSWLCFDILCVGCDWISFFATVETGRSEAMGRIIRLFRLARTLRLARAPEVANFVTEQIRSELFILFASMFKLIVLLVALAHIIACGWYGVGLAYEDRNMGWVTHLGVEYSPLYERYARSLHWSLAHFTGEPMVIEPQNGLERGFAVTVLLFTFIFSTLFGGSVTTSMTRLMIVAGKEGRDLALLRRFLSDRSVSMSLSVRMQRNAQHALLEQKRNAPEESVELLKLVSEPLRIELHYEIYSPTLLEHPFFFCYNEVNPVSTRKICHSAVSSASYSQGDIVFSDCERQEIPMMYFVDKGQMSYEQNPLLVVDNDSTDGSTACMLEAGQWACEGVLWTTWMTYGTLTAREECRLIQLDADKFRSIVAPYPTSHPFRYAMAFVSQLNSMSREDLSDLWHTQFTTAVAAAFPDKFQQCDSNGDVEDALNSKALRRVSASWTPSTASFTPGRRNSPPPGQQQARLIKKMSRSRSGILGGSLAGAQPEGRFSRLERFSNRLSQSINFSRISGLARKSLGG